MTEIIKIKVTPKSVLKGKMDVRFPARVQVQSPILLDKTGGVYTFTIDVNAFGAMLLAGPLVLSDREINAAGPVTIIGTDELIRINKTASQATTVNLIASAFFAKSSLIIKDQKGDATNFPISITPNGTETIDGQPGARLIDWPYGGLRLRTIAGGWITLP